MSKFESNHILVGLGGTGGKILKEFKMRMFEEYPDSDVRNKLPISLLYVDTTKEMLGIGRPDFNVMGLDASFTESEFLDIKNEVNITNIIDDIGDHPQLKGIVDNVQSVRTAIGNLGEAAGQKRRAGRLLFGLNARGYITGLQRSFAKCHENNPTNDRTVHIFAGLSGGTGSGAIIDAIAQTRKLWNDAKILVYVMLPERDLPKPDMDKGRYYQNAYAALKELNALQCGAYQPCDVTGNGEPLDYFSMNIAAKGVANGITVYSNVNGNGHTVHSFNELPRIVSDYAYARIFLINKEEEACHDILRAFNFENLDGFELENDERINPDSVKENEETRKSRTRKISSFAIKRVIYPELRVLKHITYTVGEAVLNQFKYNNWTESKGYINESPNKDYRGLYVTKEKCDAWKINLDHLTLEKTVLPTDKNYQAFMEDWRGSIDDLTPSCETESNPLAAISDCMNNIYNESFREGGVEGYYNNKRRVFRELAAEMRRMVEVELYKLWRNGDISANDLKRIVEVVAQNVSEDLKAEIENAIVKNDEELKASSDELSAIRQDWANVGIDLFGKKKRLYAQYCDELAYYMTARTKVIALKFAQDLQQVVNREFGRLVEDVTAFGSMLSDAIDCIHKLIIDQRKINPGLENVRGAIVEVSEEEVMSEFEIDYRLDEQAMRRTSQQLREAIIGNIEFINFNDLNQRVSVPDIQHAFDITLSKSVKARHEDLPASSPKVLELNILSQLAQQLDSEQAIHEFAKQLLTQSDPYVSIDNTQIDRYVRNNEQAVRGVNINLRECLIAIPTPGEDERLVKFAEKLKKAFENCSENGKKAPKVFMGSPRKNELYIVTINSGFPLRAIQWLKDDKRKFDSFLNSGNKVQDRTNAIMLFGEGDGSKLPDIFALSETELKEYDKAHAATAAGPTPPPISPAQPPVIPGAQALPQVQLFLAINGAQYGPYDFPTCQAMVTNGQLTTQTLVWEQGMAGWTPAGQVAKLQALFAPAIPNVPPMPPMGGPTPPPIN